MGAYGALKAALSCPERFSAAFGICGSYDFRSMIEGREKPLPWASYWEDIFGDRNAVTGSGNDLMALADALTESGASCPLLYLACPEEGVSGDGAGELARRLPEGRAPERRILTGTRQYGDMNGALEDAMIWLMKQRER